MIRKSKWIADATPSHQASEVATLALRGRLDVVAHYLPLAAKRSEDDIEYVHQLRVATRRAMAAIDVFAPLLSETRAKKMFKRLRKIRRAGGAARDNDVLAIRIETLSSECDDVAWGELIEWVQQQRAKAQKPLRKMADKFPPERFESKIVALLESVHDPLPADKEGRTNGKCDNSFETFAQRQLKFVLDRFFEVAASDLVSIEALHAFRVEGKSLRYSMELLAPAFDSSFRKERYADVSAIQQLLGDINDHANAIRTFEMLQEESSRKRLTKHLQKLAVDESQALSRSREEFTGWWTPERAEALREQLYGLIDPNVNT